MSEGNECLARDRQDRRDYIGHVWRCRLAPHHNGNHRYGPSNGLPPRADKGKHHRRGNAPASVHVGALSPTELTPDVIETLIQCGHAIRQAVEGVAAEQDGLTYLGEGLTRTGYLINGSNLVLKIANGPACVGDNLTEKYVYDHAPQTLKKWLAPVLFCSKDGRYIVVPKCTLSLTVRQADSVSTAITKETGFEVPDIHNHNVGLLNGKTVVTDYGFGVRAKDGTILQDPTQPSRW